MKIFACKFIHYNQYMARLSWNLLYVCQTKTLDTNGVSWFCISTISFAYFLMHMTGLAVATIKIPLLQRPCIHWVVYTSMKKLYRSHESSLTLTEIKYCCSNYQKICLVLKVLQPQLHFLSSYTIGYCLSVPIKIDAHTGKFYIKAHRQQEKTQTIVMCSYSFIWGKNLMVREWK